MLQQCVKTAHSALISQGYFLFVFVPPLDRFYRPFRRSLSTEEEKEADQSKPEAKDDLNAEEDSSSSEEDDGLTNEGKKLKEILDRDAGGRDSNDDEDDDEDEDPDADPTMGGTSALFLQGEEIPRSKNARGVSSPSHPIPHRFNPGFCGRAYPPPPSPPPPPPPSLGLRFGLGLA